MKRQIKAKTLHGVRSLYSPEVAKTHMRKKQPEIKVFVIIPEKLYQNGISNLIGQAKGIKVREGSDNWLETLSKLEKFKPHILITSLEIPTPLRTILFSFLKEKFPSAKVLLICTKKDTDEEIIHALSEGASGYVLTQTGKIGLLKAIKGIYEGEIWTPRRLMGIVIEYLRNKNDISSKLSLVDKNVALLLANGLTDKEIAQKLRLSYFTVREHLERIYNFLGVSSRSQAIVKLLKKE